MTRVSKLKWQLSLMKTCSSKRKKTHLQGFPELPADNFTKLASLGYPQFHKTSSVCPPRTCATGCCATFPWTYSFIIIISQNLPQSGLIINHPCSPAFFYNDNFAKHDGSWNSFRLLNNNSLTFIYKPRTLQTGYCAPWTQSFIMISFQSSFRFCNISLNRSACKNRTWW